MTTPNKTCKICGQTFPATTEFFHKAKHDQYGVHRHCKQCRNAYRRERYANDAEYAQKAQKRFHHWYYANITHARNTARKYAANHRKEAVLRVRRWREDNPERYRAMNSSRDWKKHYREHRDRYAASAHRYRARRQNAPGKFTEQDITDLYEKQEGLCAYCGKPLNDDYHIDHVIPLSRGGTNYPRNLALACPFCNCSKGDRLPHEWEPIAQKTVD